MPVIRKLIRADGRTELLNAPVGIAKICELIGATVLDSVMLADRQHVMLVDDTGMIDGLPINAEATRLYHERAPGSPYSIHGDVVIVPDSDFGADV